MNDQPRPPRTFPVDAPAERIDLEWEDQVAAPVAREPAFGTAMLILCGAVILLIGFFTIDSLVWILDIMARAPVLGWAAAAALVIGLGLILWAIWRELRALFAIREADALRNALSGNDNDLAAARHAALDYVSDLRRGGAVIGDVRARLKGANGIGAVRHALDEAVLTRLDAQANAEIRAAAAQVFGMAAVSPTAGVDAALFTLRGIRLVRRIATIYGLRPRSLSTLVLLRRVMVNASLVAAGDIAGGMLGHALLTNPFAQKLAGEVAGATIASQRMWRLGRIAQAACRPISRKRGD